MIEIIPNWHPLVVHFTIALIVISALLHLLVSSGLLAGQKDALTAAANWNLWLGAGFGILAVLAGIVAYNSVNHDTPSHLAMTDHRNWALPTLGVCLVAAIVSILNARKKAAINWLVTGLVLVAAVLIAVTGFKGGELVYRHGLGVMSLPKADSHGHAPGEQHSHGESGGGHGHDSLDSATQEHDHGHDSAGGHDSLDGGAMHDHGSIEDKTSMERSDGSLRHDQADEGSTHTHADGKMHEH